MSNINAFWAARTQALVYGPDQPTLMGNAVSEQDGYIYYDPGFVAMLDAQTYSYAPSQMVFAHEFGHQIQFSYGTFHNDNLQDELGADCYAGFFVAWLACNHAISNSDIMNDFSTMCTAGSTDPGLPWWATGAHGNCQQRTSAFAQGARAYATGLPPLNGCTL
jgi:predicted metalloprotease